MRKKRRKKISKLSKKENTMKSNDGKLKSESRGNEKWQKYNEWFHFSAKYIYAARFGYFISQLDNFCEHKWS